jgi:diaminopropionate ammonia-lyase
LIVFFDKNESVIRIIISIHRSYQQRWNVGKFLWLHLIHRYLISTLIFISNKNALHSTYPDRLKEMLSLTSAIESQEWLSFWPSINMTGTPLWQLQGLARQLGVAHISLKDESRSSPLGSFTALGAPIALLRLIIRR